jgi:DNA topoisomerase-1
MEARNAPAEPWRSSIPRHVVCGGAQCVRKRPRASKLPPIVTDPVESAEVAGLRYVTQAGPGIRRRRAGRGFVYFNGHGPMREPQALARIRALAIPPAWTDVWICPSPTGHIQAVGRDARGRKQYRYHSRWRAMRDESKYTRMLAFARALPRIRERVKADLRRRGLPREKVLATIVRLLETTLVRVGNEEYARANKSFGLTTLRDRHVDVTGAEVRFQFRGKGGKEHAVGVRDPRVARIVGHLQDLPGQELFQYLEEGRARRSVDSGDVNAYLREISGEDFTAKDFRTWAGTVLCALALAEAREFRSVREARRNVTRAIAQVAARLGNTPAISRKCYVHPVVLDAYMDGVTIEVPAGGDAEDVVRAFLGHRLVRPAPAARAD